MSTGGNVRLDQSEPEDPEATVTEPGATGGVTMARMLQELLAERKHREIELAEERRVREEELRRQEAELREEHHHREEANARREDEMRHQMELLTKLVEGVNKQGDAALKSIEKDRQVKVTKLTEADDIEAYLTTFERLMKAYNIPPDRWSF